jgi:hypothetical protein
MSLFYDDITLNTNKTLVVFAIAAAFGLLGIVVLEMTVLSQDASAACERGRAVNKSLEKSDGRCFDRGTF